jgi:hypothetical protein
MKSPIVVLPVLLQIALVAALYTHSSSTPSPVPAPVPSSVEGRAEIRQLQQQREEIEARLAALESRTRVVLPRGLGGVADGAPPPPTPSPNLPANPSTSGIQTPAN